MKNGKNDDGMGKPGIACSRYREEMQKAAKDSAFVRDIEDTTYDFAAADKEALDMSEEGLPQQAGKPSSNATIDSSGRENNACEKRGQSCGSLNPPLEAIQNTLKKAIAKIHAAGLSTVHCDERGNVYLRYPDGRKEFCEAVIAASEADVED